MRKGPRATPGRFRTRVITEGVYPSLHVDYKATRIKQYHQEGRALRTETTINNTRDFEIGKRLPNLPALREGRLQGQPTSARRPTNQPRLLDRGVRLSRLPAAAGGRSPACLRARFRRRAGPDSAARARPLPPTSQRLIESRSPSAARTLRGRHTTSGSVTYDLRRLRLRGLIRRIPHTHRYQVTPPGLRYALFFTRSYDRLLRPGLAVVLPDQVATNSTLRASFRQLQLAMTSWAAQAKLAS